MSPPCRSLLFLPASNPRAVEKARGLDCDIVALDLEDAVGPDDKAVAREAAVKALTDGGFGERRVLVRINGLDTAWGRDDLAALAPILTDGLILPKVDRPDDVAHVRAATSAPVWAMVETPAAILRLDAIAGAPGLGGLMLGVNDLGAALGCRATADRAPLQTAMSLTVAAARAHGLMAIDGVFNDLEDGEGLARECQQGREFGFDGKALIHPSQIAASNAAFRPDAEEIAWARAVVAAYDDPANAGRGAIRVQGRQTERLHLDQARRWLALHGRVGTP